MEVELAFKAPVEIILGSTITMPVPPVAREIP